jgi:hypothetical protein
LRVSSVQCPVSSVQQEATSRRELETGNWKPALTA